MLPKASGSGAAGTGSRTAVQDRMLLHVLTDRTLALGRTDAAIVSAAILGGATVIQLRGKQLTGADLVHTGRRLAAMCRAAGVVFIVNDRLDVALAVESDGAHIGQDDLPPRDARRLLGPDRLLGVSVCSVDEAVRAVAAGADYLGVGPVFETATKRDAGPVMGLDAVTRISQAVSVPVVAIGGITAANAGLVIAAGAAGVAVISAIVAAPDVGAATLELRRALLPRASQSPTVQESTR